MVFDRVLAAVGAIIYAPVAAAIAIAIKLDDGGPIWFRQRRVGLGGRPFEILKFRTMADGRPTRVGTVLRRTGLDETAQFLSVLAGHMRVVGPRPLTLDDVRRLGWDRAELAWRWSVRPGITGLAQILGGRSARHSLALDRLYLARRSVRLDLCLIALSVAITFVGKRRVRAWLRGASRRSRRRPSYS